ncbi:hypothetical protein PF010_g31946, partial [Phytophthora fragariae]
PVVMLFTNCVVLVWYGYLSEDIFPLFVTAIMGLVTCAGFIAVFYRYTDDKRSVHRICAAALAVIVIVCIYGTLGVAGVTDQSKSSLATAMGAISIATSIGLYGSPLATIRRVIRSKSTASMPFTLCLANFSNSVCWVVYAVIVVDVWVLIPNVFGCVLTTIQWRSTSSTRRPNRPRRNSSPSRSAPSPTTSTRPRFQLSSPLTRRKGRPWLGRAASTARTVSTSSRSGPP